MIASRGVIVLSCANFLRFFPFFSCGRNWIWNLLKGAQNERGGERKSFGGFNNRDKGAAWECDKCQFYNDSGVRTCGQCKSFNKNADDSNDWECTCGFKNFANRHMCFKCKTPNPNGKPFSGGRKSFGGGGDAGGKQFPADWDCPSCGVSNFAKRGSCFKCSTANPNGSFGDNWECSKCSFSNFPSRYSCFKCQEPNPNGGDSGRKSFGGGGGGRGGRGGRGGGGRGGGGFRGGRGGGGNRSFSGGDDTPKSNKKITFDE